MKRNTIVSLLFLLQLGVFTNFCTGNDHLVVDVQLERPLIRFLVKILRKYGLDSYQTFTVLDLSLNVAGKGTNDSAVASQNSIKTTLIREVFDEQVIQHHVELVPSLISFFFVFISDCKLIRNLPKLLKHNENVLKSRFLVILFEEGCLDELTETLWETHIINVIIVTASNLTHVSTYTYFPFQYQNCNNHDPVLLHSFSNLDNNETLPHTNLFFPNKLQNMQKCSVTVALFEDPPSVMLHQTKTGRYDISGKDAHLLKFLSNRMNFTLEIVVPENEWASITRSGNNITGTLQMIAEGQAQMTIGTFIPTPVLFKMFTSSKTIAEQQLLWVVPIHDRLGPFERLFNPMSDVVWMSLIVLGSFICLMILTLTYAVKDRSYKNFIFGKGINAPLLKIFGMYLGVSVDKMPNRTFARYLFMSWMQLSFFVRMMYEANVISALTSQTPQKTYNSLTELNKAGYNFVMFDIFAEFLDMIKDKNRIKFLDHRNQYSFVPYFEDSNILYAILSYHSKLCYFNQQINMSLPFYVSKQRFLAFPKSIFFHKSSVIAEEVDANIKGLPDNGILLKWRRAVIDERFSKFVFRKTNNPLGMKHLQGGFYLLIGGLTLACISFVCEVLWKKCQKIRFNYPKLVILN